jgi:hypothetical protein
VLVVRGEAGIGKTALLGYLGERASGFRIASGWCPTPRINFWAPTGEARCHRTTRHLVLIDVAGLLAKVLRAAA